MNSIIEKILADYNSEPPNIKANIYRLLMSGKLSGTGKLLILPVDQGFEHGPDRSFACNPEAYDPYYHYELAIKAGLSALAAPYGLLQAGIDKFAGRIPLILKLTSNSALANNNSPEQAVTSSVKDAVRMGCIGIGITIYPGSENYLHMIEKAQALIAEAREYGLITVIWSYPRGKIISKAGETAIDVCAYAAHMAVLLGAHIVKVKLPTDHIEEDKIKELFVKNKVEIDTLKRRVQHVMKSCFNNKRLVVFSGGLSKAEDEIFSEVKAIRDGGGSGSIMGRNTFQRPQAEALKLLEKIIEIYRN